ncbi:CPSF A subunit region protein, putative, partial [Entamoeba invadens IP1]|uniref:CPSF A subunit region protein, putative n=1 Tax=Entamoeba invadens IP1 TaxID=370355 RepID=UPI0002C3F89B
MQFVDYTLVQPTAITTCCSGHVSEDSAVNFVVVKAERKIELLKIVPGDEEDTLETVVQLDSYNTVKSVSCVCNINSDVDFVIIGLCNSTQVLRLENGKLEVIFSDQFGKVSERSCPSRYIVSDISTGNFVGVAMNGDVTYYKQQHGTFEKHAFSLGNVVCFGCASLLENYYAFLVYSIDEKKKKVVIYKLCLPDSGEKIKEEDVLIDVGQIYNFPKKNSYGYSRDDELYLSIDGVTTSYKVPCRENSKESVKVCITNLVYLQQNGADLFLLQNELGDVFLVNTTNKAICYVDTITPSVQWAINSDSLLCASECQNHLIIKLPPLLTTNGTSLPYRPHATVLETDIQINSNHPLTCLDVVDDEEVLKFHAFVGKGSRSTVKTLINGLSVEEFMKFPLNNPTNVWTLKTYNENMHKFIVIGFKDQTYVLKKVADTLTQCPECGIRLNTQTLHAGMLIDGTLLQIHSHGIITILEEK